MIKLKKLTHLLDKGDARSVRAKKNIVGMTLLKGISILCSLLIIPLTIDYVSSYEYGIWLTISSLVGWLSFFDIGIGNGLRNRFIEAMESGRHRLARIYVSTSYAIIALVVGAVWLIASGASFFVDWTAVLNAKPDLATEILYTVLIVITNFSIIFILGLVRTLYNAIQKPAVSTVFDTLTQVLLCAVLFVLTRFSHGNLVYLALAMGGTSLVVLAASNIWGFSHALRRYVPSLKCVRFRYAKDIMSLGIMFFFLQILAIAFYQTNNLIITHYLGPHEVTVYNVAFKYMQIIPMVFTIVITPFWSAFAEAKVKQDFAWMRKTRRRLMQIVLLLAIAGLLMVIISPFFYKIWIKNAVTVPFIVTLLVYIFQVINIWGTMWTQLLSGLGKIRLQVICSTICCVGYIPVSCYFCSRFGLIGVLGVSIVLPLICTSWFGVVQTRKIINRTATGIWDK